MASNGRIGSSRRNFDGPKPCIPSCHCIATTTPFVGYRSANALTIVSGIQIKKSSHMGGA